MAQDVDSQLAELTAALSERLGEAVLSLAPLGGGRNSRVYRLQCHGGRQYVAKRYAHYPFDGRDRMTAEFSSLQFLWRHGVRNIPRPIKTDVTCQCAIYEYVEGDAIPSSMVTAHEIDEVVAFLSVLWGLRHRAGSDQLWVAAEACFSLRDLIGCIQRRLDRLVEATTDRVEPQHVALRTFLQGTFVPALQELARWAQDRAQQLGISLEEELTREERTLSPSDVGFHNAIRRDGQLVFVDFEYFGWDDPAKLVADFLLHPAMTLSEVLKRRFVSQLLPRLDSDGTLAKRLEVVYPLYGLKWCLIVLNEFVPQDLLRRDFAQLEVRERGKVQTEQLVKAQRLFGQLMRDDAHFPYRDISL